MNWKNHYRQHSVSVTEAVNIIQDNQNLVFGHAAASPIEVVKELERQKERFRNLRIYHLIYAGEAMHTKVENLNHFRHISSFGCPSTRDALQNLRADFLPVFFHEVPLLFIDGSYPVDVAIINISRPNSEGFCSLSLSCDYTKAAAENANIVIAEINDKMPFVHGEGNLIHVTDIDFIVETSNAPIEFPQAVASETDKMISKHCASLIGDGATLQIGIGAIPDMVMSFLKDRKELGIHTELFTEGVIDLVESGVITGSRKTFHRGKIVATFLMGTKRMYDFVHHNPLIEMLPVDYVNNPFNIGRNNNMISINSCLEVDLTGQVASESIGLKQYSGTGGQVDYVRGTRLSKGGKSIIAMPSTAAKGKVSRIVPFLQQGATVTTSRNDVDYIATEYGIAHLRGKTLYERAKALTAIAHPSFWEEIEKETKKRFPYFDKVYSFADCF